MAGEDVETHSGEVARRIERERERERVCCTIDFSAFRLFYLYARVSLSLSVCVCVCNNMCICILCLLLYQCYYCIKSPQAAAASKPSSSHFLPKVVRPLSIQ